MKDKLIGTVYTIEGTTGEVLSSVSKYMNKIKEKFIMVRTTEGLDWYFPLSKNEKSLILLLHDWSDAASMRVSLSAWQREYVCSTLQVERRMLSILLKGLESQGCIKRLSQNDFMVNPAHAFKCSTNEVKKRIIEYEKI